MQGLLNLDIPRMSLHCEAEMACDFKVAAYCHAHQAFWSLNLEGVVWRDRPLRMLRLHLLLCCLRLLQLVAWEPVVGCGALARLGPKPIKRFLG